MDTKDTAETTQPSVAPAKPTPEPIAAGEPHPRLVPLVPLSGTKDNQLDLNGLGAAFSEFRVGTPEGKQKQKEKGKVGTRVDSEAAHERTDDIHFAEMLSKSALGVRGLL